jgi:hypothetical protein
MEGNLGINPPHTTFSLNPKGVFVSWMQKLIPGLIFPGT